MTNPSELRSRTFNEQMMESARRDYECAIRSEYPTLDQTVIDLVFTNYTLSLIKLLEFFIPGFDPDQPINSQPALSLTLRETDILDLSLNLPRILWKAGDEALSEVYGDGIPKE